MKKTALASAISLAMMSGSVWAVPCDVLGPTGQPISPFDQETGVTCSTTTVAGQFILDKSSIKAGETVNLAILGLNAAGEVDRFGEDGGSILMAVVSTTQGLIPAVGAAIPLQGSPNSGQTPDDVIAEGSFVNRQTSPSSNPDDLKTTRVIQLENGNGEINIYYPPNVSPTVGGRVTVKLQERESTSNGGIRVNTIAEVTKAISIAPPASNPFALDVVEFLDGFNDGAGVIDSDSSDGIHGMMTAGSTGAGAEVTIKALNERAGGSVALTLTPVDGDEAEITTSGSMVNGSATVSLPSITMAGDYYVKAEMTFTENDEEKTISSVDLETVDKITVIPTGVPKALSLSFNKERITQVGQGAGVKVKYLDEYGNVTTSRAGTSYTASIKEANGNTATLTAVLDAYGNHDTLVLGDAAGEISVATGTLSMSATATGLSPSSVVSLDVVDQVFAVTVLPGFASGVELISNNQVEAIMIDKDPGSTNPVTITNTDTDETSEALRDPTTGNVRALFKLVGDGPYLVSDRNGEYAQIMVDGATIVPGAPISLEVRNAHDEVVSSVLTTLLDDNSGLETDIPEKAIRLFDQYANPVTGAPAGKFTLTSAVEGATLTYPAGAQSATPTGTDHVVVNYPISAAGSGDVPLTVNLTAPGFTKATTIETTLPEVITFESIKAYVEQTTIPVNSKVALSVELLDQNGDPVEGDNAIRLVVNGTENDTINAPVIREVMADGTRGELLVPNKILNFTDGKKVFEVNAGQTTGQFTLSFVDPTASVDEPAVATFIVTQVLENDCLETSLAGCPDEASCNEVGGGYSAESCTAIPALGAVGLAATGEITDAPAGASLKGGFSVNGNAFANPATATDTGASIKIVADLVPATADVGVEADTIIMFTSYFLDAALDLTQIYVLGDGGASVTPWDFTIENIPAYTTQTLAAHNVLNILDTGDAGFGVEGNLLVLVAYRLADGTVVYSENLLTLQINDPRI